jgi:predicted enzyme involved in methoxymalonyl-ACP biosynthesis
MGRTVEHFTLNHLVNAARNAGFTKLVGEYLPTPKNVPVKTLLPEFGFVPEPESGVRWVLDLRTFNGVPSQVTSERVARPA